MTKKKSGDNLSFSWVGHALLVTNQVKHFTLVGVLPSHICFHGPWIPPEWVMSSLLYNLRTENLPSESCFHLIPSASVIRPVNSPNLSSSSAILSTSQSFRFLLKVRFHPWGDQISEILASGLVQNEKRSGKTVLDTLIQSTCPSKKKYFVTLSHLEHQILL